MKKGDLVECGSCEVQWVYNGRDMCPICYQRDVRPANEAKTEVTS